MARPKKDAERAAALDLARTGHSSRTIETMLRARGIELGRSTIAQLVKDTRAEAMRTPRPTSTPFAAAQTGTDATEPLDLSGSDLGQLWRLSCMFDAKIREALDAGDMRLMRQMLDGRILVAREIASLRPPTPIDPAKDPGHTPARDALRERLAAAVASLSDPAKRAAALAWLDQARPDALPN